MSGGMDFVGNGQRGVIEALDLLRGFQTELPQDVSIIDGTASDSSNKMDRINRAFSKPMAYRASADKRDIYSAGGRTGIKMGFTIDSVDDLGLFAPSGPSWLQWARNYLYLYETLFEGGMRLKAGTRGEQFLQELTKIMSSSESIETQDTKLGKLFQSYQ